MIPGALAALCLLGACAGSGEPQEPVKLNDISLSYSRLAAVQEGMVTTQLELEGLIREFDIRDELRGGWMAALELCRYHANLEIDASTEHPACDDAWRRALLTDDRQAQFVTAVQLYQYRGDEAYLTSARSHAASEHDRQILAIIEIGRAHV